MSSLRVDSFVDQSRNTCPQYLDKLRTNRQGFRFVRNLGRSHFLLKGRDGVGDYSNWEAALEAQGANGANSTRGAGRLQSGAVKWRRRLRDLARRLPCRPSLRFLHVYLAQGGFLDGVPGYYFARLHATYEFLTVAKVRELKGKK